MDLAALATPTDLAKLAFLKQTFLEVVHMLKTLDFPEESVRDALPIMKAAANACIFDGEYDGVVRKFYAFRGDNTRVWFTMDLFTAMPSSMKKKKHRREMAVIVRYLVSELLGEVRLGLREELGI